MFRIVSSQSLRLPIVNRLWVNEVIRTVDRPTLGGRGISSSSAIILTAGVDFGLGKLYASDPYEKKARL